MDQKGPHIVITERHSKQQRNSVIYFVRVIENKDGYYFVKAIKCNSCAVEVWSGESYSVGRPPYLEAAVRESGKRWDVVKEFHLCGKCHDVVTSAFVLPLGDKNSRS